MRLTEEEIALLLGKPGYRVIDTQTPRSLQEASPLQEELGGGLHAAVIPEGLLLGKVRRLALDNGWLFHHVLDSRGCEPGFPDVCAVKPGHPLLMLELKTERGKLTKEQTVWLDFLVQSRGVHVATYRPSQWAILRDLITRSTP